MFCNMCGKNKVSVHFQQVINGEMTDLHLCDSCAEKQGIAMNDNLDMSDIPSWYYS